MNFSELDQLPTALQAVVTHQHLSSGQILYHRNEAVRSIYVVRSGRIRLLHYTQEGQAISRYTIHAGEVCAEIVLFLDAHTCSAIAEEPTQVLVFPKQVFLNELQQNLDFAIAFMAQMSYRLHMTKEMVVLRSISSARERILHYLHLIMPPEQNTVVLEQPLKSIAYELGISPEIEVATVNPGPFLTGFNDRGFETWKSWEADASERLFDYFKLAFPRAQFDPEPVYITMTAVAAGEIDTYRNLEPKSMLEETKSNMEAPWNRKTKDGLGTRPPSIQKSYEMKPETLASS